jgi:hypothetical protein
MPLPVIPVPLIPQVPNVPGVPPMAGLSGLISSAVILTSDAIAITGLFTQPQWGIYDSTGTNIFPGCSVIAVDYRREYRVSDYPQEQGGFASYNKVQIPFDARVTLAVSGNSLLQNLVSGGALGGVSSALLTGTNAAQAARSAYLATLESLALSLSLVSVVTPEYTYPSCNVVHFDYRREASAGVTLIKIDIGLMEIRVTATQQFTTTQNPASQTPQNQGTGYPAVPTPAQSSAISTPN